MKKKIKELVEKSKYSLKNEGLKGFLVKTRNWTIYRLTTRHQEEIMKDILFINGCGLPHPSRYRVDHQIEQLEANGLTVDKIFYTHAKLDSLKYYRAVIFFRCPITDEIKKLIDKAHYFNKRVFFDIDDLVIDRKYTDTIQHVQTMSADDRKIYNGGVRFMRQTMDKSDFLITSTPALARELKSLTQKEVFVNKNVASEEMVKLSLDAIRNKAPHNDVIIGYLSGSITHNPDFELIKPALLKVLDEYENTKLCIMGFLDIPEDFKRFENRIIKKPFCDWRKLPEVIASLDINLAPLEETIFNEAKSENKWTEASLTKTLTIASNFGTFGEVIEDGKTGLLAKTPDDWYKKLKFAIENPGKARKIAESAHAKVMKGYVSTYSGLPLTQFIESKLAKNIGFVLPTTNISGGVNVVLKHCDILRRHGWDVMIINMDKSDENLVLKDGELNVVSSVTHSFIARFDALVATLYTTLPFVKAYSDAKKKFYLVQNFETDFNDYGSPMKRVANATYHAFDDINYLTISKWCQAWLKEDYKKNSRFALNGLDLTNFPFHGRKLGRKIKILIEGNSDDHYKNVDESFKIVERLDKTKFEISYLSYQGKPKSWYRVDRFYHRVPHEDVGKVYAEHDILLKSSLLESFSYPPLEMMATGGFAIVAPNGGNREYLEDHKNCLLYEPGNIDDAIARIHELIETPELQKTLSEAGRATALSRDWNKIENKILELYS